MTDMPVWERRFRAPKMTLPHWSRSAPDRTAFASNESGVWQVHAWDVATGERRKISDHPVGVTHGISTLEHAEHGDVLHPSIRVVDPRTGGTVGERGDGTSSVHGTAWSPVAGDQRLAIAQDDRDRQRIAVWDLSTDGWSDVDLALPGDVAAVDWWPDASALLVIHAFEGRHELYRV